MRQAQRGVYFLANDRMIDWAIGFLASFRRYNPDLPLCLIPYDGACRRLLRLACRYGFEPFPDAALLAAYDDVYERIHDRRAFRGPQFRKCAIWSGPFERFVYIDVDTVILRPLDFVYDWLGSFDVVAAHSNPAFVWRDSIRATGALTPEQIAFGANAGFLASCRGRLGRAAVEAAIPGMRALRDHAHPGVTDQPFLNYLVVTSGLRYTTLEALNRERGLALPEEVWAGEPGGLVDGGTLVFPGRNPALFLHWAGTYGPRGIELRLRRLAERVGWQSRYGHRVRWRLPYKDLWRYYRHLAPPEPGRPVAPAPAAGRS